MTDSQPKCHRRCRAASDAIVTTGCGDFCPYDPGDGYVDPGTYPTRTTSPSRLSW